MRFGENHLPAAHRNAITPSGDNEGEELDNRSARPVVAQDKTGIQEGRFSAKPMAPPKIEKGSEVGIGIAHSDADQGLSLVIFDELKCGACFFTVLHQ